MAGSVTLGVLWLSQAPLLVWTSPPGYVAMSTLPLCAAKIVGWPGVRGAHQAHRALTRTHAMAFHTFAYLLFTSTVGKSDYYFFSRNG